MRKGSILLITIAVSLMSASPSYAKKITHSNSTHTQSALLTKGDKVKCGKYHSPLVKIPQFKLVKQTCQELYSGQSSMEFKAVKIYSSKQYESDGFLYASDKQAAALKKTLKRSLAKGWTVSIGSDSDYCEYFGGYSGRLSYINKQSKKAIYADLNICAQRSITGCKDEGCMIPSGTSWLTISVSNLHQNAWE